MYAHLETVNSWVFLPLKPEEIPAFKENAALCLDKIFCRKYHKFDFRPASSYYNRAARLVVELPGPVEWDGCGFNCKHGYGAGTHVLERRDGYAPHGCKVGKSVTSAV